MNQQLAHRIITNIYFSKVKVCLYGIIICIVACAGSSCGKKSQASSDEVPCFNADKVHAAYKKVKDFLAANEHAYINGTIDKNKIGLYIDMTAAKERMDYYTSILALGKGVNVPNPDGTTVAIDDELIRNYKEALCNEADDVNIKL